MPKRGRIPQYYAEKNHELIIAPAVFDGCRTSSENVLLRKVTVGCPLCPAFLCDSIIDKEKLPKGAIRIYFFIPEKGFVSESYRKKRILIKKDTGKSFPGALGRSRYETDALFSGMPV